MEANISSVLRQDTECISAVHCLKVFCQRLGCDLSSGEAVRRVAGCAFALATEALSDLAVLQFPPSLTAAAVLVAARRAQARPFHCSGNGLRCQVMGSDVRTEAVLQIPPSPKAAAVLAAARRARARPSSLFAGDSSDVRVEVYDSGVRSKAALQFPLSLIAAAWRTLACPLRRLPFESSGRRAKPPCAVSKCLHTHTYEWPFCLLAAKATNMYCIPVSYAHAHLCLLHCNSAFGVPVWM